MKKITWIVAASTLAIMGCSESSQKVVIATDAPFGKFEYVDDNGNLTGFEVELGNAACAAAKLECEWQITPWDSIFAGLEARKYDAIISSVSIKPDREEKYLFSVPYYTTPSAFFVPNDSTIDPSDKTTLEGLNIGVQTGTLQDEYITDYYGDIATIKRYQGSHDVFEDIKAGRIDTFFMDYAAAEDPFLIESGADYRVAGGMINQPVKYFGKGVGVVLNKRDTELQAKFNEGLEAVFANGEFDKIMTKYFDYDISIK